MNKDLRIGRKLLCLIIAIVMVMTLIPRLPSSLAYADAGQTPPHSKTRTANNDDDGDGYGDGTYKLELSVTGDSDPDQAQAKANILFVYDTSYSMRQYRVPGQGNNRPYRADAAEKVVYDFINGLIPYQNQGSDIQVSLVTFAATARTAQGWTTNLTNLRNQFSSTGAENSRLFNYGNTSGNGVHQGVGMYTNWDAAMRQALTLVESADADPTFVIFITDGAPTTNGNGNTYNTQYVTHYNAARTPAYNVQSNAKVEQYYGIYAYGNEADYLDDLVYYAYNRADNPNIGPSADESVPNYFNATDTEALNEAMNTIFNSVIEYLGVTDVVINDGTTNNVTTTAGVNVELLDVDEDSYEYWISMPVNVRSANTYVFQRPDAASGQPVDYTITDNGNGTFTITRGSLSLTVEGSITGSGNVRTFKYKWEANNGLDKNPPSASLNHETGSVVWDLDTVGTLLDGVTYSVTFDVYPSQYTYDLISDLKNGLKDNSYLEAQGLDDYLIYNEETNSYALETNTTASLTWNDTRPGGGPGSATFDNPPAVPTEASAINLEKNWVGRYGTEQEAESIVLDLVRVGDSDFKETIELTKDGNKHVGSHFIAIGLLTVNKEAGTLHLYDAGHDYQLQESGDLSYHWELTAEIMHPMLVNGEVVMMKEVTDGSEPEGMADGVYKAAGGKEYYGFGGNVYVATGDASEAISAVNTRRANLNLIKAVDGEDAPEDAEFTFNVTIDNLEEEVWFSIAKDAEGKELVFDDGYATGTGLEKEIRTVNSNDSRVSDFTYDAESGMVTYRWEDSESLTTYKVESVSGTVYTCFTGFYHIANNTPFTVKLRNGWNMRSTNVLTGTEFTIVEDRSAIPANFAFDNAEVTAIDEDTKQEIEVPEDDWEVVVDENKVTGTVTIGNATVTSTFTNDYALEDVEITKVWEDNGDQDGFRPSAEEFKEYLILKADGTDITEDYADSLTVTDNGDNTYTAKWTGLPKYGDGEAIVTYTVEETDIPEYTKEGSPASDKGTITNTHTPTNIDISATKVWEDANNQDGKRPNTITLRLNTVAADGTVTPVSEQDPRTIAKDATGDALTVTWTGLPKYSGGNEINYTVTEDAVDEYTTTITGDAASGFTVTNSYTPETTTVNAEKIWKNGSETLTEAPEAITLHLNKSVNGGAPTVVTDQDKTIAKGASGDALKVSWTGLPKYEAGQPITYTVTEDTVAGYTTTITGNAADGFVITNSKVDVTAELLSKTVTAENTVKSSTFEFSAVEVTVDEATGAVTEVSGGWTGTGKVTFAKGEKGSKTVTFGENPISYSAPGTYYYKITETTVPSGWTATYPDGKDYALAKVTVTKNDAGELSALVEKANISNAYAVQSTTITLGASKTLSVQSGNNAPDVSGKYDLTLKDAEGNTVGTVKQNPDGNGTSVNFETITYTAAATYTYTVSESCNVQGGIAGVTDDAEASGKTVVVTVTDNGDGTLTARVTSGSQITNFTNTYNAAATSLELKASKTLAKAGNAKNPPDVSRVYDLTLTAGTNTAGEGIVTPMPTGAAEGAISKKNPDGAGTEVSFGSIPFTVPGEYNYTVTESGPQIAGVTNGTTSYDVTVKVTDNGSGQLVATVTKGNATTAFTNTYSVSSVTITPEAAKVLEGRNLKTGEFEFTLSGAGGVNETKPNDASGAVKFSSITYDKPGTYNYTIVEKPGELPKVTYDTTTKNVVVTVKDNGAGELVAEVKYDGSTDVPVFTNTYTPDPTEASITVNKELTGRDLKAGEFTFTLDLTDFKPAGGTADSGTTDPGTDNSVTDDTTSEVPSDEASGEAPEAKAPAADNAAPDAETPETETPENEAEVPSEESTAPDEISTESDATVDGMSFTGTASIDLIPTSVNNAESAKAGTMAVPGVKAKVPANQKHLEAVNKADGSVTFDTIEYNQAGTYYYTIQEVKGTLGGVTYSTETIVVTVEVTYDKDTGKYTAEVKYPEDKTFNNTYAPKPTSAAFEAKKVLTGRPLKAGEFEFTLTGSGDVSQTKTNAADGSVTFDEITYDKTGTYTYTIKETKGSLGGVTYDEHEATVTVVVTDDLAGQLHAEVTYSETVTLDDGSTNKITLEEGEVPTFSNTYEPAPVKEKIEVSKALTGRAQEEGEFSFSLVEVKGEETVLVDTATNTAEGKVTFKEIEYTEVSEHTYKVSENIPTETKGITYDTSVFEIKVKITDDLEGNLVAQVIYPNDKEFNNTYEASGSFNPEVTKILEGKDLKDGEFKFTIKGPEGKLPASTTITNDAQGIAKFGAITCDETNIGDVYEYTITEVNSGERFVTYDEKVVTLKVTVVDNKDGTLSFTKEYTPSTPVFNNTFKIIYGDLKINKTVDVYDDVNTTSFVFGITAILDGVKVYDDVVSLDFDEAGTLSAEIKGKIPVGSVVTVKEIFASGSYELTSDEPAPVTIVENETAEVNFTNTYNNKLIQGYGILNEYTNDGTGWNHKSN